QSAPPHCRGSRATVWNVKEALASLRLHPHLCPRGKGDVPQVQGCVGYDEMVGIPVAEADRGATRACTAQNTGVRQLHVGLNANIAGTGVRLALDRSARGTTASTGTQSGNR